MGDYQLITKIDKSPELLITLFLIKKWKGTAYNKDVKEPDFIKWVSFSEARTLKFPADFNYNELLTLIETKANKI